jgi:hypothetical protein
MLPFSGEKKRINLIVLFFLLIFVEGVIWAYWHLSLFFLKEETYGGKLRLQNVQDKERKKRHGWH